MTELSSTAKYLTHANVGGLVLPESICQYITTFQVSTHRELIHNFLNNVQHMPGVLLMNISIFTECGKLALQGKKDLTKCNGGKCHRDFNVIIKPDDEVLYIQKIKLPCSEIYECEIYNNLASYFNSLKCKISSIFIYIQMDLPNKKKQFNEFIGWKHTGYSDCNDFDEFIFHSSKDVLYVHIWDSSPFE
jgi:hypothetical protein